MKKLFIILVAAMVSAVSYSQQQRLLDAMEDSEAEDEGLLTLRFLNAETGAPVEGATINLASIGEFLSDEQGRVRFKMVEDGKYTFTFYKQGFIPAKYEFNVLASTIFFNHVSVSPMIELGDIRIVLDWDAKPRDLDAHLVKEGAYHISYRQKAVSDDNTVRLDRDDMDGYGPETITINNTDNQAFYYYFVDDYTNKNNPGSKELSNSHAVVRIYNSRGLLNEFYITPSLSGNRWEVFTIKNGSIR
jgi:hypothetical protein